MEYEIPDKIIRIVELFYEDFQCAVEDQGEVGEWFNIKTGVKQGCNMLGFIFLIETRFLELAMSLLDFSPRIPLGTFSILLVMDWVMRKAVENGKTAEWRFT